MPKERRRSAVHEPDYQYMIGRVRQARVETGLTQTEVAHALGRPLSFVSKCELGERRIDPINLRDFATLYGKPLEYFYPSSGSERRRGKRRNAFFVPPYTAPCFARQLPYVLRLPPIRGRHRRRRCQNHDAWVPLTLAQAREFVKATGLNRLRSLSFFEEIRSGRICIPEDQFDSWSPRACMAWKIRSGSGNKRMCILSCEMTESCGGYANGNIYTMQFPNLRAVPWNTAIPGCTVPTKGTTPLPSAALASVGDNR